MSSHHTYIPWFPNKRDPEDGLAEAKEQEKTLRLCNQCKDFKQFTTKEQGVLWLYLHCPDCDEIIKIPRECNHAARKWDKEKWK